MQPLQNLPYCGSSPYLRETYLKSVRLKPEGSLSHCSIYLLWFLGVKNFAETRKLAGFSVLGEYAKNCPQLIHDLRVGT